MINSIQAKQARGHCGLSQGRVVKITGINRSYLSQFETGKRLLSDADIKLLEDCYHEHGWVEVEAQPNAADAISSVESTTTHQPAFLDGIQVPINHNEVYTESLMDELHSNDDLIKKLMVESVPVSETFLGLGEDTVDLSAVNKKVSTLVNLLARNYCIVREVHGWKCLLEAPVCHDDDLVAAGSEHLSTIGCYLGFQFKDWDFQSEIEFHQINSEDLEVEAVAVA